MTKVREQYDQREMKKTNFQIYSFLHVPLYTLPCDVNCAKQSALEIRKGTKYQSIFNFLTLLFVVFATLPLSIAPVWNKDHGDKLYEDLRWCWLLFASTKSLSAWLG